MVKQPGFWNVEERLQEISADGGPLETLAAAVDFERFRPTLERAAGKPPGPSFARARIVRLPDLLHSSGVLRSLNSG